MENVLALQLFQGDMASSPYLMSVAQKRASTVRVQSRK